MAAYRYLQTSFWQDAFVLELTPEEKYFYIYLMTNGKTSQCGIYELPKKIIENDTGYNRDTIEKYLKRFIDYGKILYSDETKEIMILNWLKFNFVNSPKVKNCMRKELEEVKNKAFLEKLIEMVTKYKLCNDTLWIPYQYPIDTLSIDYGEKEKEKEKEKENIKEKEKQKEEVLMHGDIYNLFTSCGFGTINLVIKDRLEYDMETYSIEWVAEAIKEAVLRNVRNLTYVEAILQNWLNNGGMKKRTEKVNSNGQSTGDNGADYKFESKQCDGEKLDDSEFI